VKNNLNINTNMKTSSSQNNIQTMSKKLEYPKYTGSMSTSPSIKSKYIIETKKVEYFKKPKNYSVNKTMNTNTLTSMSEINRYEVKEIMHQIWNEESYCSTVESLCCLSDKMNESQNNTMIFEEYEEEIGRLKKIKDKEYKISKNYSGNETFLIRQKLKKGREEQTHTKEWESRKSRGVKKKVNANLFTSSLQPSWTPCHRLPSWPWPSPSSVDASPERTS